MSGKFGELFPKPFRQSFLLVVAEMLLFSAPFWNSLGAVEQTTAVPSWSWLDLAQFIVLTLTMGAVAFYTCETSKLRRETRRLRKETAELRKDASEDYAFSAITEVCKTLGSVRPYKLRGYLHRRFDQELRQAVTATVGEQFVNRQKRIDTAKIVGELHANEGQLNDLNTELNNRFIGVGTNSEATALETVETTLFSFDSVAFGTFEGLPSAQWAARVYRSAFQGTAEHILPFVALQMKLRGDPEFRFHYIWLLYKLKIKVDGMIKLMEWANGELEKAGSELRFPIPSCSASKKE